MTFSLELIFRVFLTAFSRVLAKRVFVLAGFLTMLFSCACGTAWADDCAALYNNNTGAQGYFATPSLTAGETLLVTVFGTGTFKIENAAHTTTYATYTSSNAGSGASYLVPGTGTYALYYSGTDQGYIVGCGVTSSASGTITTVTAYAVTPPGAYNFGPVALPATATKTLTFSIPSGGTGTIASVSVVTMGAPNLDFTESGTDTCSGKPLTTASTCTVTVQFQPLRAGWRKGGVLLKSSSGAILSAAYVQGIGTGAQLAYQYGAPVSYASVPKNSMGTYANQTRLSVDGNGNLVIPSPEVSAQDIEYYRYPSPYSGTAPSPVLKTTGLVYPGYDSETGQNYNAAYDSNVGGGAIASAIDGVGNIYLTGAACDCDGNNSDGVIRVDPAGNATVFYAYTTPDAPQATATTPVGIMQALTVGGDGTVYIFSGKYTTSDTTAGVNAFNPYTAAFTHVPVSGLSFVQPYAAAIDSAGNLYVADGNLNSSYSTTPSLYKISGTTYSTVNLGTTIGAQQTFYVSGLAVDSLDNLFVSSAGSDTSRSKLIYVVPALNPASPYSLPSVAGTSFNVAGSLAFDAQDNLYVQDIGVYNASASTTRSIYYFPLQTTATTTFAAQAKGTTSPPQTLTLTNIGNAPLAFTAAPSSSSTSFVVASDTDSNACVVSSSGTVPVGGVCARFGVCSSITANSCTIKVASTPHVSTGTTSGALSVTGNVSAAQSSFALSGAGAAGFASLSFTGLPATTSSGSSNTTTVTALDSSSAVLTGFTGTLHFSLSPTDPAASLPPDYTFSGSEGGTKTFNVALSAYGSHTVTVADTLDSLSAQQSTTVGSTVNHFAFTAAPPPTITAGTAFNVTVTAYTSADNSVVVASYAGPVAFTSTDTSAVFPATLTMTSGVGTFAITLKKAGTQTLTVADSSGSPSLTSGNLTVSAAAASTVTASSGSGQSAVVGVAFANPLVVQTVDAYSNPVGGVTVSFAVPSTGQSATLSAASCVTSATATPAGSCSVTATANSSSGSYSVTASSGALTSAAFTLTNNAAGPQAAGVFGGSYTPPYSFTNLFNAQLNAYNSIVAGDPTTSTSTAFRVLYLSGSSYANATPTTLSIYNYDFGGVGINTAGAINYCYFNYGSERINSRTPSGGGSYTIANNVYTSVSSDSARCTTGPDGTVYIAPADGTLQTAVPAASNSYTVKTVTGTPAGVTQAVLGYYGSLILNATAGTYVGTLTLTDPVNLVYAWTGTLVTSRDFYNYAAYQDASGTIYLEDATTQAGYQEMLSNGTYTESAWTKPFGLTAVAYSYNNGGSLMVASSTAVKLQYSSSLIFPPVAVTTSDPVEELVFQVTAAGTLGSIVVSSPGGATDFADAGTGTCTTNGTAHSYAVGDLCTVDVKFTPTRGGTRTGTVAVNSPTNSVVATAALTGTGIGQTIDHLTFTTVPTSATIGTSFSVTVTAYADAAGTTVATIANGTATVTSSDTAATLPTNVAFTNGVATFNVTLNTAGSKTLTVADPVDNKTVTSSGITVGAAITGFTISTLSNATAGSAQNATITALNGGNTSTSFNGSATITSTDAAAAIGGATIGAAGTSVTFTNGVAAFTGSSGLVFKTAGQQAITVSFNTITQASNMVTVSAAAAASVAAYSGGGQSAVIGAAFTNALVVQTLDAYLNPVSTAVTFSVPTSGANASLSAASCTTSLTATPAGSCSVTATANGLASATAYNVSASVSGVATPATFSLTNAQKSTTIATTPTATSLVYGQAVTLNAVIMPASVLTSAPAGYVKFTEGATVLTSTAAVSSAAASTTVSVPTVATHTYTAQYLGDTNFAASAATNATSTVAVAKASATLTGPSSTTQVAYGSSASVSIAVAGQYSGTGISVPSGTISYSILNASSVAVASGTASIVSGTAAVPVPSTLASGSYTVSVSYSGDSNYNAATAIGPALQVGQITPTVSFSAPASPLTYGSALGIAATATYNSSSVAGSFAYTATPTGGTAQAVAASTVLGAGSYTLTASFTPTNTTQYNAASNTMSLVVQKATPTITTAPTATGLTYGQTLADSTLSGGVGFVAGTFAWTAPSTAPGAGTASYSVTFTPTDTTDYNTATVNVSIVTAKATPTITVAPTASSITYGQTLASSTLSSGVGSVAGSFAWTTPTTTTTTGTASYSVTFTPTDSTDYNAVTTSVSVQTTIATPTITTAPTASAITYGQTLASSTLSGGVASTAGTFAFTASATAPNAGTASYTVTFTPTDTTDYTTTTTSVSVVTNPAAQTISFTQPGSPITYGAATTESLSATGGASGNAVTFSVASGPGSIAGNTLTITGAGTVVVNANQAASSNYAAAITVQKSVVVNKASATLSGPATQPVFVVYNQTGTVPVTIAGQYSGTGITSPSGATSYTITNASNATVASGSLTIASGAVSVPVANTLAPGLYTVTANYAGDGNYSAAAQLSVSLQVGQITPAIVWAQPAAITYGATLAGVLNAVAQDQTGSSPITVAGTYSYAVAGNAVTSSTVLPAGTTVYTVSVTFTPTNTTTYKTATGSVSLTVNKATPAVSLTSSVNPLLVQNATTLTATVSSAVSTPTGSVTFYDNTASTVLGSAVALTNGVATLSFSTLAVGTHSITAIYSGDTNFVTLTSATVSEQVDDFNLTISTSSTSGSATSQTVVPGGTATYNFTISPTGTTTFPAAVNLTVSGLPTGATYTITPSSLGAGSGSTSVTLTITVPKQTAMLHTGEKLTPIALALLLLPFSGRMRRRAGRLSRLAAMLLLLLGGAAGVVTLTGCGSTTGFFASPQTTYNVTITGTSGALSHSTTVTLTVE